MKKAFVLCVVLFFLASQVSCSTSVQNTPNLPEVTAVIEDVPSVTPTISASPTIVPTLRLPVAVGTPVPLEQEVISSENVDQLMEMARWGNGIITDAVYSPDGSLIAIGSTLGITIYESDTFEESAHIETDAGVNRIHFSPDGETLAAGLTDNTVKIWNVASGELVNTFENAKKEDVNDQSFFEDEVTDLDFSNDGKFIAAGSPAGAVSVWDVSSGDLIRTDIRRNNSEFTGYISSVFFSPDGQSLFSASWDGTVRMISMLDGSVEHTFAGERVVIAAISRDGTILVTYQRGYFFNQKGSLVLWDIQNKKKLQTIEAVEPYSFADISSVSISPDGTTLTAGLTDYTSKTWDLVSGATQNTFTDLQPKGGFYYRSIFTAAYSPDGDTLLLAGMDVMGAWNISKGNLLNSVKIKSESIVDAALSPDGQTLAYIEGPGVNFLQLSNGNPVSLLEEEVQSTGGFSFLPSGDGFVITNFDGLAQMLPLSDQGTRRTYEIKDKDAVRRVAVSPDGKILALGASYPSGKVELVEASTGKLITTLSLNAVYDMTDVIFSSDGALVGVTINDSVKVFEVETGRKKLSFRGGISLALSPDTTLLAAGADDKSLRMWKLEGGEAVLSLKDRPSVARSVVFSPDGKLLFVGNDDGTIEIFLVSDGSLLRSWRGHSSRVSNLIFTPDGERLISSSYDGTIRIWGVKP